MKITGLTVTPVACLDPRLRHSWGIHEPFFVRITHYPWNAEDIIPGGMCQFTDGCLAVPTGLGLGVRLDEAKLAAAHERFRNRRVLARDNVTEMKQRGPHWLPLRPRW